MRKEHFVLLQHNKFKGYFHKEADLIDEVFTIVSDYILDKFENYSDRIKLSEDNEHMYEEIGLSVFLFLGEKLDYFVELQDFFDKFHEDFLDIKREEEKEFQTYLRLKEKYENK